MAGRYKRYSSQPNRMQHLWSAVGQGLGFKADAVQVGACGAEAAAQVCQPDLSQPSVLACLPLSLRHCLAIYILFFLTEELHCGLCTSAAKS